MTKPATLLDALCSAAGVQGGTIHQYRMDSIRWTCERAPSAARNTEGIYVLVWTDPNGGEWDLGYAGGSSMASVQQSHPVGWWMKARWNAACPRNRTAIDTHTQRTRDRV